VFVRERHRCGFSFVDVSDCVSADTFDNSEPRTRELSTEIWKILKTLLFSHLSIFSSHPFIHFPYIVSPSPAVPIRTQLSAESTRHQHPINCPAIVKDAIWRCDILR